MTSRKSIRFGREAEGYLPEPILQHVMSFMDFADVIRSSTVSKHWRSAVSTLQCWNLTDDFIPPPDNQDSEENIPAYSAKEAQKTGRLISAAALISKANDQNLHARKFSLKFRGISSSSELLLIDHLVGLTVSKNMEEFAFDVGSDCLSCSWNYSLLRSLYAASSLHKLVLGGLKLSYSLSNIYGMKFPVLRELELRSNDVDSEFLEPLILNCPRLVILNILDCFGFRALNVLGSHPKLERIDLIKVFKRGARHINAPQEVRKIVIEDAPNLKYFRFRSNGEHKLHFLDLSICKNLKVLELSGFYGDNKLIKSVEQLLLNLEVLESFMMDDFIWIGFGFKSFFRISSNSLKELWLGSFCSGVEIQVDAPQLSKFVHSGYMSSALSFETSSKMVANIVNKTSRVNYDKLLEFLRSFNLFEEVSLDDFAPHHFGALKYLENKPDPPLLDVKRLNVRARYTRGYSYIPVDMEVLEGLLWMAPQLESLSFENLKSILTLQFKDADSVNGNVQEVPFVSGNNVCIKVKVESCQGDAQGYELKKYYFDVEKSMSGFVEINSDYVEKGSLRLVTIHHQFKKGPGRMHL